MENTTALPATSLPSKKGLAALRPGQWVRFAAVAITLAAIVCFICLPQIQISFQRYDNNTVSDRVLAFPTEVISGVASFFGGSYFSYYKTSNVSTSEALVSQKINFNFFSLACVLIALLACGMDIWLNLTKKNEKWSKLVTLFFIVAGLMAFMGPIFFLATNGFGSADFTKSGDNAHYWNYYELYVHDTPGALITGLLFVAGGICFGVGTGLEGGDKNDNRQDQD